MVSSRGPVFFHQVRVGKDGKLFGVLEFRAMHVDAESAEPSSRSKTKLTAVCTR